MKKKSILPGAEPIFVEGNEIAFLFIHGFTGSPYEGKDLALYLHKNLGLTVSVPILPGHGTSPSDLKEITWQNWYSSVRKEYFKLKAQYKHIVVCGISMGGTLALHLSSHHPVDTVISLAGAVFLKDWRLKLLPIARHLITYNYKSKGPDIRDKNLKFQIPSYSKYPVRSIDQVLGLMRHTREDLPEVTAPALLIHSEKDRTVHFSNLQYIYDHISSKIKKMVILNESYHVISIDVEKKHIYNECEKFIKEILIEKSIELYE